MREIYHKLLPISGNHCVHENFWRYQSLLSCGDHWRQVVIDEIIRSDGDREEGCLEQLCGCRNADARDYVLPCILEII